MKTKKQLIQEKEEIELQIKEIENQEDISEEEYDSLQGRDDYEN
ncbi:MAG TPA: hypothetical protein VGB37_14805 [Candidatus Lokiarchaeia archaeon]